MHVATNSITCYLPCTWTSPLSVEEKSFSMEHWEDMAVPPNTCLLYVDTAQQYKCTVDGQSITFNLQGTIHSYKLEL